MAIERCFSLRKAAKVLGVGKTQLKRMLLVELQLVLPEVMRGSRQMIPESVLQRLIEKIGPHRASPPSLHQVQRNLNWKALDVPRRKDVKP
jgi:hypothetical protein